MQLRGEYLYAAMGSGGFRAFDVANIDNKNFSEKIDYGAGLASGPEVLCQNEICHGGGIAFHACHRSAARAQSGQ